MERDGTPSALRPRRPASTIADVARRANVSTATVSRVFSQPGLVADSTRRQVMAAAADAQYRPNRVARALRQRRSGAILVLVPDLGNPFYPEIVHGIERAAHAEGYTILMGNTAARQDYEASYLDLVHDGRADGMLLLTGRLPPGIEAGAPGCPPVVLIAEHLPGSALPTVRIDNVAAAERMTAHLVDLGHRRIAHVTGPMSRILSVDRLAGYRRGLGAAGLLFDPALVAPGDFTYLSGRRAAERLLETEKPPTAIFAANDEMAAGVMAGARARRLRVPQDLSVAGFDDVMLAEISDPPLTTIRQPRRQLGAEALRLLIGQLKGAPGQAEEVLLPTLLVPRGSTSSPPGTNAL